MSSADHPNGSVAHVPFIIIGAGPAGLTAAYELTRRGHQPLVLESSGQVGGISRTHVWNGNRIDIGGHRFFSKSDEVVRLWNEILDEPMLEVPRLSRIYFNGHFFHYPLQLGNTLRNLGLVESARIVLSYLHAKLFPVRDEQSFEDWVTNRFGDRLYRLFFKTYTEKVWGISCRKIRADWAAQRIHGLSLISAVVNSLRLKSKVKSLIKTFHYPRLGPGMMWECAARRVEAAGGKVMKNAVVTGLTHHDEKITSLTYRSDGREVTVFPGQVISSMPLSTLVNQLSPPAPEDARRAAGSLRYRDFLIVALECKRPDVFPDNWIYVHDASVRVGRIQNFRNWSAAMVADGNGTTLGMEYFCSRGDDLWSMRDEDLIALARKEIAGLQLVRPEDLGNGHVIRELNAYPVYDEEYREHVAFLRGYITGFSNLQSAGRNGMHRYNNQDHSMLAGLYAVRRALGEHVDPWEVNTERSYYEEQILSKDAKHAGTDILVSEKASPVLDTAAKR